MMDELEAARAAWLADVAAAASTVADRSVSDRDEIEGTRLVAHLAAIATELFIDRGDRRRPRFTRPIHDERKFLADNPDTVYDTAAISGRGRYVVTVGPGDAFYVGLVVYAGNTGGEGQIVAPTVVRVDELSPEPDGGWRLALGGDAPPAGVTHWFPLPERASSVQVRQYTTDPGASTFAPVTIAPVEDPGLAGRSDAATLARRLRAAGSWVRWVTDASAAYTSGLAGAPNQWRLAGEERATALTGTPDNRYDACWFELAEGQALVITARPPADATYWSFTLMDRWLRSLDYRHHTVHVNHTGLDPRPDGTVRLVVADRPATAPGELDTAGHHHGVVLARWLLADGTPELGAEVVTPTGEEPA